MCQQCGNFNNWNTQWNRCGCGCNIPMRRGEPGIQGKTGAAGASILSYTTAGKLAIVNPYISLIVYDTTLQALCVYTATGWQTISFSGALSTTYMSGIVAYAGGGQLNATPLITNYNRIDTAATNLASVLLFPAIASEYQNITNNGANSINVYPEVGDGFLNMSVNAPVSIVAGGSLNVFCYNSGVWTL